MNKTKISTRELKLILVFFALLILYLSYRYGYLKYTDKTDKLTEENQTLGSKLSELQKKDSNKEEYIKETKEFKQKTDSMLAEFSGGFSEEKICLFIIDMEEHADVHVSSLVFDETEVFYSSNRELSDTAEDLEETDEEPETKESGITGFQTSVVVSYQATYEGLKKCIDYINNYKEKMNISELTASFDSQTGNLTGTITITMYSLSGTNQKYLEPKIEGVKIGTDNIFGTFELPLNSNGSTVITNE